MSIRDRLFWEEQAVREGIDGKVLTPSEQRAARERLGLPQRDLPPRKS